MVKASILFAEQLADTIKSFNFIKVCKYETFS